MKVFIVSLPNEKERNRSPRPGIWQSRIHELLIQEHDTSLKYDVSQVTIESFRRPLRDMHRILGNLSP